MVEAGSPYKSPLERATIFLKQTARVYGEAVSLHGSCTLHGDGNHCGRPSGSEQFSLYQEAVLAYALINKWLPPEATVADLKNLSKEYKMHVLKVTDLYFSLGLALPRKAEGKPSPML